MLSSIWEGSALLCPPSAPIQPFDSSLPSVRSLRFSDVVYRVMDFRFLGLNERSSKSEPYRSREIVEWLTAYDRAI